MGRKRDIGEQMRAISPPILKEISQFGKKFEYGAYHKSYNRIR